VFGLQRVLPEVVKSEKTTYVPFTVNNLTPCAPYAEF